jgi:hypothetical protein
MTDEQRAQVEQAAQVASVRNRESYETYILYCSRIGVTPAPYERWLVIHDRRPLA